MAGVVAAVQGVTVAGPDETGLQPGRAAKVPVTTSSTSGVFSRNSKLGTLRDVARRGERTLAQVDVLSYKSKSGP